MLKRKIKGNKKILQGGSDFLRGKITGNRLKQVRGIGRYIQGKALLKLPS